MVDEAGPGSISSHTEASTNEISPVLDRMRGLRAAGLDVRVPSRPAAKVGNSLRYRADQSRLERVCKGIDGRPGRRGHDPDAPVGPQ
ncbi:hypothetical protein ACIRRA_43345 [Nocardia sp. NPDC101769]|uniref:hypothetical protein n=1 Tax=Nocardia sp. NPDC101769 TaxID=3364333 RepID=UPI00382EEE6E